jgi:hypothetical protein
MGQQLARYRTISAKQRATFLEAIGAGWTITHAAEAAGHPRPVWYELRTRDEAFAKAWEDALAASVERLEDELHRRAKDGYEEDHHDGEGRLIRRVHRYSPQLLMFALKARAPGKYRENTSVNVAVGVGAPAPHPEDRSASLADVMRVALDCGAIDAAAKVLGWAQEHGRTIELEGVEVPFAELEEGSE